MTAPHFLNCCCNDSYVGSAHNLATKLQEAPLNYRRHPNVESFEGFPDWKGIDVFIS